MRIRIATRGSDLARWQAARVADMLRARDPSLEVTITSYSTRGDREATPALSEIGGTGLFTAEVDRALLDHAADLAVHSLKDLPVESPEGLVIAAVPPRGPVEDVLLSVGCVTLEELPEGAMVGTSSPRRAAVLRSVRPDLEIVNLRGNVPTRAGRVAPGDLAGTVIARAALVRLGLKIEVAEILGPPRLLPAPGQGALAVVARREDELVREVASGLEDPETRRAVDAERAVLAGLGGGCSMPLGVLAEPSGKRWRLSSTLFHEEGAGRLDDTREGDDPSILARESARALREKGAAT